MSNKYLPFNQARQYMHEINLKNTREWKKWSKGELEGKDKRPNFIPSNPDVVYRFKGWKSWSDWIGSDKKIDYLPFEEAREYVRSLGFKNFEEWRNYYQNKLDGLTKPENIPWNPKDVYKKEWKGIKDWLGTEWMDFYEAREFIRGLNLKGQNEWKLYSKGELKGYEPKPHNIPSDPKRVYPDKWIDLGDWLGTERKRTGSTQKVDDAWLSYTKAKEFVHSLKLKGYNQWKEYISNSIANLPQKPRNIPKAPDFVYKNDGWNGWDDWLGSITTENNIFIKEKTKKNVEIFLSSNINQEFLNLKKKYEEYVTIIELLDDLFRLKDKKSIIEISLDKETISDIQTILFSSYSNFHKSNQIEKAFIGLLFLIFTINVAKKELSYSSLWKRVVNHLQKYNELSKSIVDYFFIREQYPKANLVEAIEYACIVFNLRNNFDGRDDEQHYIRNTILLQIGLVNRSLNNLKLWLSNYNLPIVVSELLDKEEENYSKEFSDGWRALRRYRDNIISDIKLKSILEQNIWFAHLNLENLLKLSKQRITNNSILIDDEDLPVFYLDKIKIDEMGLRFIINAQDLYTLNLSGFRYELYIDSKYSGLLIVDSKKNLVLEKSIEIVNPDYNQIEIQVKNEDLDIVFSETVILFDFNEQIIIFDENGNIYQNIFKKLNATKKYNILMDSDLDCDFDKERQEEYFDGYATLVTNITKNNNCKISYDGEFLFELNFTKYIEKPEWIDQLVLYSKNDSSFTIGNEENFILQIFKMEEETSLKDLPSNTKIVKWNYAGGYLDVDEVNNGHVKLTLHPEMITNPKHTLLIKYQGRAFKKVVQCNFFEKKNSIPRFFMIDRYNETYEVDKSSFFNFRDLEENRFYLSDFRKNETFFLKNKSRFYQKIKPNRVFKFNKFDGFGEDIFISEYLFNSGLNKLFNYSDIGKWGYLKGNTFSKLFIKRELPSDVIFIILDENSLWHKFTYDEIKASIKENTLKLDYEISVGLVIFKEEIIDSFYNLNFLDSFSDFRDNKIVNMLLLSNYPFLLKSKYTSFIRNYILYKKEEFFRNFYKKKNKIDGIDIKLDFSKYAIFLEHICMGMDFGKEGSSLILEDTILNKTVDYFIETPIILFNLLRESKSKILISYFDNILSDIELIDERDNSFIDKTITNLFNSSTIKGIEKHNLKVAMHYINGKYYLREALRRI